MKTPLLILVTLSSLLCGGCTPSIGVGLQTLPGDDPLQTDQSRR